MSRREVWLLGAGTRVGDIHGFLLMDDCLTEDGSIHLPLSLTPQSGCLDQISAEE